MKENYPALLLKAEAGSPKRLTVQHDETGDLDAVFSVTCRVLASHKLEPRPGDTVVLMVPSGSCGDEEGPATRTRYWFVSGPEGEDWMPRKHEKLAFYLASALDFYGVDAEKELLPWREELHGIWRTIADRLVEPF